MCGDLTEDKLLLLIFVYMTFYHFFIHYFFQNYISEFNFPNLIIFKNTISCRRLVNTRPGTYIVLTAYKKQRQNPLNKIDIIIINKSQRNGNQRCHVQHRDCCDGGGGYGDWTRIFLGISEFQNMY